jgi:hypothetical protein
MTTSWRSGSDSLRGDPTRRVLDRGPCGHRCGPLATTAPGLRTGEVWRGQAVSSPSSRRAGGPGDGSGRRCAALRRYRRRRCDDPGRAGGSLRSWYRPAARSCTSPGRHGRRLVEVDDGELVVHAAVAAGQASHQVACAAVSRPDGAAAVRRSRAPCEVRRRTLFLRRRSR